MASKISGLEADDYSIKQTIDLVDLFGKEVDDDSIVADIGQSMIDLIISRTEKRKDVNGKALKSPYSDSYAKSSIFKEYGKSKNKVNMTLTGDMLSSIEVLESDSSQIVIGFNDPTQEAKAANHNQGITVPERPFFGVNDKELKKIKSKFIAEIEKPTGQLENQDLIDYVQSLEVKGGTEGGGLKLGDIFDLED
jgi:hypothetical protein